ncbi:hypothetical protein SAMN05880501_11447 [Ureibacillus xyleni]|uniref:Uncharacterized protein n=1 Tax=Ureibacillus xyleni TaxID=614648 RepID=A0A285TJS3_9BACL|nr:hypothetical protein [Ureibacillus xyleni]SOC22551.1 hypothetical protein SAMN05880501_11447 [Ureibacillus xyleni]
MDEEKVERLLREAKNFIPVDQQLKKTLRKSFEKKRKRKPTRVYGITVAAALLFLSIIVTSLQSRPVNANELLVTHAISFVDVARGNIHTMIQNDGNIYVTMKNGESFILSEKGLTKTEAVKSSPTVETDKFKLYEEQGNIIKENLKNNEKTIVDQGHSPSISMSGDYIAYIKKENDFDQVWIADTDLETKKQLTSNLLQREVDLPLYEYRTPVWGEDNTIYLVKDRLYDTEIVETTVMKIGLGTESLSSEETVDQFMQALMVRDDDYAKSLMVSPPEFLTVSNPRITGYQIISVKDEFVQVEVTRSDSHLPYTSIDQYEFRLNKVDGRYKIEDVSEINTLLVSSDDMKTLQITQNGETKDLISINQLDKNQIKSGNYRLSSTYYNSKKNVIYFGVQEMGEETSGVSIWSYDIQREKLEFLLRINQPKVLLESMIQSPNGKYLALNLFPDSSETPFVYVVDLEQQTFEIANAYIQYWNGETMMVDTVHDQYRTLQPVDIQNLEPIK